MSLLLNKANHNIFYPRMKYPHLALSSVNWCKMDVFTSNIMALHHKMSQTVKIKVNRHTNIYLLMKLFSMKISILHKFTGLKAKVLAFVMSYVSLKYWWVKNSTCMTWQTQKGIGRKPFTCTSDVSAVKTSKKAFNFP